MRNLIYKELKLCLSPAFLLFTLCGALMLVPSYPYEVAFFFSLTGVQIAFATGLQNNDQLFTINLPVKREDVVKAKYFDVLFLEMIQIAVCVLFALLSVFAVGNKVNQAGISPNFTLFGVALLCYSAFNTIFLPKFFKTGAKWGVPYCLGLFGYVGAWLLPEVLINAIAPLNKIFGGLDGGNIIYRLIFLAVCATIYTALLIFGYKRSVKYYEKVSL